jgi:hypothetical protein
MPHTSKGLEEGDIESLAETRKDRHTQQTQEQIDTTNCGKRCSFPWQPRSEEEHDGKEKERGVLGQSDCNQCRKRHFLSQNPFFSPSCDN